MYFMRVCTDKIEGDEQNCTLETSPVTIIHILSEAAMEIFDVFAIHFLLSIEILIL